VRYTKVAIFAPRIKPAADHSTLSFIRVHLRSSAANLVWTFALGREKIILAADERR